MTVIDKKVNVYLGPGIRVLEDDQDTIEFIKGILKELGLENVEFFTDTHSFIATMHINVHMAIVDETIKGSSPDMQGIDVIEILRTRFPEVQIIFFSGTNNHLLLKRMLKFRPEGYVDKNESDYLTQLRNDILRIYSVIRHNIEFVHGAKQIEEKYNTNGGA